MTVPDNPGYADKACNVSQADCIIWVGPINNKGYGVAHIGDTTTTAHRLAWTTAHGPLPKNLTVDHLCRNRRCVNVDHLEPVTYSENYRRSPRTQVTHCPAGHPLDGDNLRVQIQDGRRKRSCLICHRQHQREWERRQRGPA